MPFVVEKLSASVPGSHWRVCARSAQPAQRSSTVSPRHRTASAPPPRPRATSLANDSTAGPKAWWACPRTPGGRGCCCAGKAITLRKDHPRRPGVTVRRAGKNHRHEPPFSRDQRRWVYASSKRQINTFGFGTDNEMEQVESLVIFKHSPFPVPAPADGEPGAPPDYRIPAGKVLGAANGRRHAFSGSGRRSPD